MFEKKSKIITLDTIEKMCKPVKKVKHKLKKSINPAVEKIKVDERPVEREKILWL